MTGVNLPAVGGGVGLGEGGGVTADEGLGVGLGTYRARVRVETQDVSIRCEQIWTGHEFPKFSILTGGFVG